MKKLIILFFFIFSVNAFAVSNWVRMPSITGIADNIIYKVLPDGRGNLFASIRVGGIYKTTNGGVNWTLSGVPNGAVYNLILAPNGDLYGIGRASSAETIYKSTDDGASWQVVYSKIFSQNVSLWGEIIFPSNGPMIAAFSVTVYPTVSDIDIYMVKSSNGGNNWSDVGFLAPIVQANTGGGSGMVLGNDGKIYLGTGQTGLISSPDLGASWSGVGSVSSMFTSFVMKGNTGNAIYEGEAYGINRSTDNCSTFNFLGPTNAWSYTKEVGIGPNDEVYFALSDGRVFITNDNGATWTENHVGLSYGFQVMSIAFMNGKVYLAGNRPGTYDGELYYFDAPTGIQNGNSFVKNYELKQNYPNPFNPSTTIAFNVPKASFVNLTVFDLLGKKVTELINEQKAAGVYEINFDASKLSSGIYYYKLQSDNFSETKKMILSK